jgi:hypothetical protein
MRLVIIFFVILMDGAFAAQKPQDAGQILVTWHLIRSRSQVTSAGSSMETYQSEWSLGAAHYDQILISAKPGEVGTFSPTKVLATWTPVSEILKVEPKESAPIGVMTLTRADFIRLLGAEQELTSDVSSWRGDELISIPVLSSRGRVSEQVFRHADDNGTLVIRLLARLASVP